jgi:hypothetical protein
MVQYGLYQLFVQRRVAPEMRSRVLGVQSFATAGAQPVGAGIAVAVAGLLGPREHEVPHRDRALDPLRERPPERPLDPLDLGRLGQHRCLEL